ncbi:alcohol acetyltransferase [Richelia sinica FACHB-800]|uniref:Phthiocerol/phthiodiolone dimycocerosyl transferase n=1 Tax=Richelia sinica FACHB-800 TaxID=1357546 RepID=A0A975TCG9_9NOST|nr:condensation domain-containing protein [Richelia sinica]MBD2666034.1 alcohol acetyltransferase [Richelia sinica FACHB-800]QXE26268.1 alcohol acetyltransferase [Richelia sinica FACHB-800]
MPFNRKLGRLEQAMEILNSRAKTWNLVTISRIKGQINSEILQQSLEIVQYHHPLLNARIIHLRNSYYFQTVGTETISLNIVGIPDVQGWTTIFNQEMNQVIDSSRSLLRVVLIYIFNQPNINYLLTTVHHAITDGLSSIQLHSEILSSYQKLRIEENYHAITALTPIAPVETLLPRFTRGIRGSFSKIKLLLRLGLAKIILRPKTLGIAKYVSIDERRSEIIHRQLDPDLTEQFIQRCRQESTTVHGALCAALMLTFLANQFPAKRIRQPINVNCLSYLDLRSRLNPPIAAENMSILASSIMDFYQLNTNTSFWDLARKVKQNLAKGIQQGDIFHMISIAKLLIDFLFFFPQQVAATVSVSNVGKVKIPHIYGDLELETISFAGSQALYAGMLVVHAATFQKKMLFNFVFSQPAIATETMEKIVEDFISCLYRVAADNSLPQFGGI